MKNPISRVVVAGATVMSTIGAFVVASLNVLSTPLTAAPVEYVKICDDTTYGVGYFYIPGTDTCMNPLTGETRRLTEAGMVYGQTPMVDQIDLIGERIGFAFEGVAIGLALPQPIMPAGHTFALTGNWGQFQGANAFGLAGALAITPHIIITGGVGVSVGNQLVGTRAGWNLSFGGR